MIVETALLSREHLPRLPDLFDQLGYVATAEEVAERFDRLMISKEDGFFVATEATRGPVGFLHAKIFKSLHASFSVEVVALIVDQKVRGLGIGKKLMERAEEWARQGGYNFCWLRTNTKREEAHRFYEILEFSLKSTSHKFEKKLFT